MITEVVLLEFIFWEILCHTGYPTESLGFYLGRGRCLFSLLSPKGKRQGKKNPPSYGYLSQSRTLENMLTTSYVLEGTHYRISLRICTGSNFVLSLIL